MADDVAGGVEVTEAQAAEDGLAGMLAVVVHGIAERHTEADGVEAQLIDQLDEVQRLLLVVDTQVDGQQVERLVVELGVELAGLAAAVRFVHVINVLVAGNAALEARFVLDEVRLLHGLAVQAGRRVVALRPEVGFRQRADGMQARDVAPGAAGAVGLLGVAVVARALAAADFLVGVAYLDGQLAAFQVGRLGDDGQHVLRAHDAAHAAASGEAGLALPRLQLVDRAASDGGISVVLPVFAGRPDRRHVRIGVTVGELHDLVVRCLAHEVGGVFQRQAQVAVFVVDQQVHRTRRAADEHHFVHACGQHLGAEFAGRRGPHGEGLAVVGRLERAVGGEEDAQAGHQLGAGEDAEVHDQRRRGGVGVAHVVLSQGFEGAPDAAEEVFQVGAGDVLVLDSRRAEIDAHAPKPVVRKLFGVAGY